MIARELLGTAHHGSEIALATPSLARIALA